MAPFILSDIFGHWGQYVIFVLIGIGFGMTMEMSGFGNSRKLAGQFYLNDMTVLKVMFGSIITAMVLIFLATSVGLLDYNLVWVNPTYLWPGIVGGLIMGVGFIIGGFCPGTSLVAAATAKVDGIFFVAGVVFGIFMFGETVSLFDLFWNSSYLGRLTIMDWLNLPTGVVVLGIVLIALFLFWGGELLEQHFGGVDLSKEPKHRYTGAGVLALASVGLIFMGQPDNVDRWARISAEKEPAITDRLIQIEQGELIATMKDDKLNLVLIDVRPEADYNQFHLLDARHVPLAEIPSIAHELTFAPANSVFVLMSNDEAAATEAWKVLVAESVPNVYLLEGGVNAWLATFGDEETTSLRKAQYADDTFAYAFPIALGARNEAAKLNLHEIEMEYTPKIVLERKRAPTSGGCG